MPPRRAVRFNEPSLARDTAARDAGEYATMKIDIPDTPFLYYDSDDEDSVREYVRCVALARDAIRCGGLRGAARRGAARRQRGRLLT